MGVLATAAAQAFRNYVLDGVPASGANDPFKSEIRPLFTLIEAQMSALASSLLANGATAYAERSALYADLAHPAGSLGVVYADAEDEARNGFYVKSGSSGSGAWTQTDLGVPSTYQEQLLAAVEGATAAVEAASAAEAIRAETAGLKAHTEDLRDETEGLRGATQDLFDATAAEAAAAQAAQASASASAGGAATAFSGSVGAMNLSIAAASSAGPIIIFDTKADAEAGLGGVAEDEVVEVMVDEDEAGIRTRYRKEGGVLVFKLALPVYVGASTDPERSWGVMAAPYNGTEGPLAWKDNVFGVRNNSIKNFAAEGDPEVLVAGNAAINFYDAAGVERAAAGYAWNPDANAATHGYHPRLLYLEIGNPFTTDDAVTDFGVVVTIKAGGPHWGGAYVSYFPIYVHADSGEMELSGNGSNIVAHDNIQAGTLGEPRQVQVAMDTTFARFRERPAANQISVTTNWSNMGAGTGVDIVRDDAAVPTWDWSMGGGVDRFALSRAGVGETDPTELFIVDQNLARALKGLGIDSPTQGYNLYRDGPSGFLRVDGILPSFSGFTLQLTNGSSVLTEVLRVENNGEIKPGTDNVQNLGSASKRFGTVYAGTGTINTSDAGEKVLLDAPDDAFLAALLSVPLVQYQWKDSIAAKGEDGARIHYGPTAQGVRDALTAAGFDPCRYALFCEDAVMELRPVETEVTGPIEETVEVPETMVEVVDGVATQITRTTTIKRPVMERLPVVDAEGRPVMETVGLVDEQGQPVMEAVPVIDPATGRQKIHTRPVPGPDGESVLETSLVTRMVQRTEQRQAVHVRPLITTRMEMVETLCPTGEVRLGLRLDQFDRYYTEALRRGLTAPSAE